MGDLKSYYVFRVKKKIYFAETFVISRNREEANSHFKKIRDGKLMQMLLREGIKYDT